MANSQSIAPPADFQIEEWRPVVKFEGLYEVSSLGRIRSLDRLDSIGRRRLGQVLENARISGRYFSVRLCKNGRTICRAVHILVLEAFVCVRPLGMQGCHFPDRNTRNNRLDNLRWDTPKSNCGDRLLHGTVARGERNGFSKISESKVAFIRFARQHGIGGETISRAVGINSNAVRDIADRKSWKHVDEGECPKILRPVFRDMARAAEKSHYGLVHARSTKDPHERIRKESVADLWRRRLDAICAVGLTWFEMQKASAVA